MPNFYKFVMRHGEFGVQKIIEQIEHLEGIIVDENASLEQRWNLLMQGPPLQEAA